MATVRITKDFIISVESVINLLRIKDQQAQNCETWYRQVSVNDAPWVKEQAWGNYSDLEKVVPSDWLKKTNEQGIMVHDELHGGISFRVSFTNMLVPPTYDRYQKLSLHRTDVSRVVGDAELSAKYPEIVAIHEQLLRYDAHKASVSKWANISTSVVGFFQQFPTLNAALKAAPEMRLYVPESYLRKLEEKTESARKAKTAVEVKVDTGQLAALAMAAKLN